jgi:hypothetical protein
MLNTKWVQAAAVMFAFAGLMLSSGASPQRRDTSSARQPLSVIAPDLLKPLKAVDEDNEAAAAPDPLSNTSTFYRVRSDLRRCVSPMCGGNFVRRVNLPLTRCADGRYRAECYVAEILWNGQSEIDTGQAILRGRIVAMTYGKFGNLGALRVSESWRAASNNRPEGTFYQVRDRGVRCIVAPCPTHHEAKLNSTLSREIAGVDLVRVSEAPSLSGPDGVIVAGEHVPMTGPGGKSVQLKATQVYLKAGGDAAGMKPCIKTGCSREVCSDQNVITTCIFRPEYACYQKATCERQPDGNCGFTKTRELASCLAAK